MDISCSFSLSIKRVGDAHARNVLWALAGTLAATVIIFGGLGSIQNQCRNEDPALLTGITGFSGAVLTCKKLYRYYWFITSLNLVTAVYGAWTVARGFLARSRGAVLGLLVVACLQTINMTNAFLSIVDVPKFQDGPARDRARTMIAGCIIAAFFQAVSIILVGYEPNATAASSSCCTTSCEKKTKTKNEKTEAAAPVPAEEAAKPETAAVELSSAAVAPAPAAEPAPAPAAEPAAEPAADVEAPAPAAAEETPSAPEAPAAEEPAAVAVSVQ